MDQRKLKNGREHQQKTSVREYEKFTSSRWSGTL